MILSKQPTLLNRSSLTTKYITTLKPVVNHPKNDKDEQYYIKIVKVLY